MTRPAPASFSAPREQKPAQLVVRARIGRYIVFYLLVGVAGALAQFFSLPTSMAPMIGASGAIAGVLGGYLMLFPRASRHVREDSVLVAVRACRPGSSSAAGFSGNSCFRPIRALHGWPTSAVFSRAWAPCDCSRRPARSRRQPADVEYLPPPRRRSEVGNGLDSDGGCARSRPFGGLAQLVRAGVSYAPGPGFESLSRHRKTE